jgi:DNA-binding transcriptional LysR family regulator
MNGFFLVKNFDLNDIVPVLQLARSGNKSATASRLGLDASTVGRRIAAVESSLGVRIFVRTASGYELTKAGEIFVAQAEQIQDQVNAMLMTCVSEASSLSGVVRITAIDFFFDYWLVNHLSDLVSSHPRLNLELITSDNNLSFRRREADLALRLSKPTSDAALFMKKVGNVAFGVYGTTELAGMPSSSWPEMPWITYDESLSHTPEMLWMAALGLKVPIRLRVNNLGTMIRACAAGNGLALLPWALGEQAGLVRLSEIPEVYREVWLLSHRDAGSVARFKAVSDWLVQTFEAAVKQMAGPAVFPA